MYRKDLCEHWLKFKGVNNTRDLGGYQTVTGLSVMSGRIIRSGELSKVSRHACHILKNKYKVSV